MALICCNIGLELPINEIGVIWQPWGQFLPSRFRENRSHKIINLKSRDLAVGDSFAKFHGNLSVIQQDKETIILIDEEEQKQKTKYETLGLIAAKRIRFVKNPGGGVLFHSKATLYNQQDLEAASSAVAIVQVGVKVTIEDGFIDELFADGWHRKVDLSYYVKEPNNVKTF